MTHHKKLTTAYSKIVDTMKEMGYSSPNDVANFEGTPERAAKALLQLIQPRSVIHTEIDGMLAKIFPAGNMRDMIISQGNLVFGMCPHHLLPVIYRVTIAYVPKDKVIGISKLTRIAKLLAGRPVLQEQFTHDLANVFYYEPDPNQQVQLQAKMEELAQKVDVNKEERAQQLVDFSAELVDQFRTFPSMQTVGSAVYTEALHMCMACRGAEHPEVRIKTSAVRGIFRTQPETRKEFFDQINLTTSLLP